MKKLMAEVWFFFNFRRDILARIRNLDERLLALEQRVQARRSSPTTGGRFPGGEIMPKPNR
jgi:hypothetical protein